MLVIRRQNNLLQLHLNRFPYHAVLKKSHVWHRLSISDVVECVLVVVEFLCLWVIEHLQSQFAIT